MSVKSLFLIRRVGAVPGSLASPPRMGPSRKWPKRRLPQTRISGLKGAMVSAADPRAVEAGLEVLRQGGHAVDAAIAVHTVLGLVEPQSSGIGGGAFMLVYERDSDEIDGL